jgi:hypothetical protein
LARNVASAAVITGITMTINFSVFLSSGPSGLVSIVMRYPIMIEMPDPAIVSSIEKTYRNSAQL